MSSQRLLHETGTSFSTKHLSAFNGSVWERSRGGLSALQTSPPVSLLGGAGLSGQYHDQQKASPGPVASHFIVPSKTLRLYSFYLEPNYKHGLSWILPCSFLGRGRNFGNE